MHNKSFLCCSLGSFVLMIVCLFLAVNFAGDNGMAVCFLLFYAVNPVFSIIIGIYSGLHIQKLWYLPFLNAILFIVGTWLFFEFAEPDFILYAVIYLMLGVCTMVISYLLYNRSKEMKNA